MDDLAQNLPESSADITAAESLLRYYSFEMDRQPLQWILQRWLARYPVSWVRLALIEALHQGRYKTISVEQILISWQRRGKAVCHFNGEFERLVCQKFPRVSPAHQVELPLPTPSPFPVAIAELPGLSAPVSCCHAGSTEILSLKASLDRGEIISLDLESHGSLPDMEADRPMGAAQVMVGAGVPIAIADPIHPFVPRTTDANVPNKLQQVMEPDSPENGTANAVAAPIQAAPLAIPTPQPSEGSLQ